jgi:hypothetical protein
MQKCLQSENSGSVKLFLGELVESMILYYFLEKIPSLSESRNILLSIRFSRS